MWCKRFGKGWEWLRGWVVMLGGFGNRWEVLENRVFIGMALHGWDR
jgi:hypothetical protein